MGGKGLLCETQPSCWPRSGPRAGGGNRPSKHAPARTAIRASLRRGLAQPAAQARTPFEAMLRFAPQGEVGGLPRGVRNPPTRDRAPSVRFEPLAEATPFRLRDGTYGARTAIQPPDTTKSPGLRPGLSCKNWDQPIRTNG